MLSDYVSELEKELKQTEGLQLKINLNYRSIITIDRLSQRYVFVKELYLNHNQIDTLKGIEQFVCLEEFHIKFNYISNIDELERIKNKQLIKILNLKGNPVEKNSKCCFDFLQNSFPNLNDLNENVQYKNNNSIVRNKSNEKFNSQRSSQILQNQKSNSRNQQNLITEAKELSSVLESTLKRQNSCIQLRSNRTPNKNIQFQQNGINNLNQVFTTLPQKEICKNAIDTQNTISKQANQLRNKSTHGEDTSRSTLSGMLSTRLYDNLGGTQQNSILKSGNTNNTNNHNSIQINQFFKNNQNNQNIGIINQLLNTHSSRVFSLEKKVQEQSHGQSQYNSNNESVLKRLNNQFLEFQSSNNQQSSQLIRNKSLSNYSTQVNSNTNQNYSRNYDQSFNSINKFNTQISKPKISSCASTVMSGNINPLNQKNYQSQQQDYISSNNGYNSINSSKLINATRSNSSDIKTNISKTEQISNSQNKSNNLSINQIQTQSNVRDILQSEKKEGVLTEGNSIISFNQSKLHLFQQNQLSFKKQQYKDSQDIIQPIQNNNSSNNNQLKPIIKNIDKKTQEKQYYSQVNNDNKSIQENQFFSQNKIHNQNQFMKQNLQNNNSQVINLNQYISQNQHTKQIQTQFNQANPFDKFKNILTTNQDQMRFEQYENLQDNLNILEEQQNIDNNFSQQKANKLQKSQSTYIKNSSRDELCNNNFTDLNNNIILNKMSSTQQNENLQILDSCSEVNYYKSNNDELKQQNSQINLNNNVYQQQQLQYNNFQNQYNSVKSNYDKQQINSTNINQYSSQKSNKYLTPYQQSQSISFLSNENYQQLSVNNRYGNTDENLMVVSSHQQTQLPSQLNTNDQISSKVIFPQQADLKQHNQDKISIGQTQISYIQTHNPNLQYQQSQTNQLLIRKSSSNESLVTKKLSNNHHILNQTTATFAQQTKLTQDNQREGGLFKSKKAQLGLEVLNKEVQNIKTVQETRQSYSNYPLDTQNNPLDTDPSFDNNLHGSQNNQNKLRKKVFSLIGQNQSNSQQINPSNQQLNLQNQMTQQSQQLQSNYNEMASLNLSRISHINGKSFMNISIPHMKFDGGVFESEVNIQIDDEPTANNKFCQNVNSSTHFMSVPSQQRQTINESVLINQNKQQQISQNYFTLQDGQNMNKQLINQSLLNRSSIFSNDRINQHIDNIDTDIQQLAVFFYQKSLKEKAFKGFFYFKAVNNLEQNNQETQNYNKFHSTQNSSKFTSTQSQSSLTQNSNQQERIPKLGNNSSQKCLEQFNEATHKQNTYPTINNQHLRQVKYPQNNEYNNINNYQSSLDLPNCKVNQVSQEQFTKQNNNSNQFLPISDDCGQIRNQNTFNYSEEDEMLLTQEHIKQQQIQSPLKQQQQSQKKIQQKQQTSQQQQKEYQNYLLPMVQCEQNNYQQQFQKNQQFTNQQQQIYLQQKYNLQQVNQQQQTNSNQVIKQDNFLQQSEMSLKNQNNYQQYIQQNIHQQQLQQNQQQVNHSQLLQQNNKNQLSEVAKEIETEEVSFEQVLQKNNNQILHKIQNQYLQQNIKLPIQAFNNYKQNDIDILFPTISSADIKQNREVSPSQFEVQNKRIEIRKQQDQLNALNQIYIENQQYNQQEEDDHDIQMKCKSAIEYYENFLKIKIFFELKTLSQNRKNKNKMFLNLSNIKKNLIALNSARGDLTTNRTQKETFRQLHQSPSQSPNQQYTSQSGYDEIIQSKSKNSNKKNFYNIDCYQNSLSKNKFNQNQENMIPYQDVNTLQSEESQKLYNAKNIYSNTDYQANENQFQLNFKNNQMIQNPIQGNNQDNSHLNQNQGVLTEINRNLQNVDNDNYQRQIPKPSMSSKDIKQQSIDQNNIKKKELKNCNLPLSNDIFVFKKNYKLKSNEQKENSKEF